MTNLQKETVRHLREAGLGYKAIAEQTGMSSETIRSFIKRNDIVILEPGKNVCLNCGKRIRSTPGKKPKKFCSHECGLAWWHQHPSLLNKKAVYSFTCPACGKHFTTYGQSSRKYCSHQCYINARYKGVSYEA